MSALFWILIGLSLGLSVTSVIISIDTIRLTRQTERINARTKMLLNSVYGKARVIDVNSLYPSEPPDGA